MKSINQTVEVKFHAIEVKDAVIMAELMNKLAKAINNNAAVELRKKLSEKEQENYRQIYYINSFVNENPEQVYNVLANLGFIVTEKILTPEEILDKYRKK